MQEESRAIQIELLAGDGNLKGLQGILSSGYTQLEIDTALENAIAYSRIETAEYLLSLGADFSNYNYRGVYYAVHNDELEGLKFAIKNGVDINLNNGILINSAIQTAINSKSNRIFKWLLDHGADPKLITNESSQLALKFGDRELNNLLRKSANE